MSPYDVARLAAALRAEVRGAVGDDARTRALYATDGSNYRAVPDLVVVPADVEDLATAVTITATAGAPVTMRGGGTSMAGNAIGGVVIDGSRHVNRILALDPQARTAVVEPGVVLTHLLAAARPHGLTFGADPSSGSRATLGGMIANNACGAHSVAWGTTADNLRAIEVLLADGTYLSLDTPSGQDDPGVRRTAAAERPGRVGQLHRALQEFVDRNELAIRRRFGQFTRQISGYPLHRLLPEHGYDVARLLCGTEGGFAATLRATVQLTPLPVAKVLCVLGFNDSIASADCVPVVLRHGPLTMESINAELLARLPAEVRDAADLPPGTAWLLVELGADDVPSAVRTARAMLEDLRDSGVAVTAELVTDTGHQAVLWRCRKDAAGLATRRADGAEAWGGWEDAAVPPARLGDYLRGLDELLARHGLSGASYGHFGEGCMHMRIDFDLLSERGLATYRAFIEQAADLVVSLGGSVSGEHGDGRARGELLGRMYGADGLALLAEAKRIWDPTGVLNPGAVVDPPPFDADIRHDGPAHTRQLLTVFAYGNDNRDFAQAQRRCVGIGNCRQTSGGVMCPSYQVTRDELHSTRGRAHLLWEMLEGTLVRNGWRSTEVRDGLDLCLSCKGCLSDCPVNVDMATYKAEFTHHHFAGRPWARPRSHWSMGWLPLWARLASGPAARTAGRLASTSAARKLGGIADEREVPSFARQSFTDWFGARSPVAGRKRVLLWPDTFTNYLTPEVGKAAVAVLADAGFEVVLPERPVCCGLTWISTGQLTIARRVLRRSLAVLEPHLAAGTPIVGLEPSCAAALRHDAPDLLGDDALAAKAARSTYTFAQVLREFAPDWEPPRVDGQALVQTHCHQHAVLGFDAERALMAAAGIDADVPDSGCCGLAGNFGFERDHYDVSMAVGERVLLPAVRAADPATAILADGFSCRTQIAQATTRRPQHLAELLANALIDQGPD
ncbi:FAD-binding and (Fe-S)-binding domain-containing protein [Kribbella deserti]|uniref:FAD-binding and (Fe-S)-binding domain-containing protein n=1 Tax=Kribbella deserti TaxID=1926257 RepID=A0ABV6QII1_9ACTN